MRMRRRMMKIRHTVWDNPLATSRQIQKWSEKRWNPQNPSGIHPHDASNWDAAAEQNVRRLAAHPKCVGAGGRLCTGLGWYFNDSSAGSYVFYQWSIHLLSVKRRQAGEKTCWNDDTRSEALASVGWTSSSMTGARHVFFWIFWQTIEGCY